MLAQVSLSRSNYSNNCEVKKKHICVSLYNYVFSIFSFGNKIKE